MAEQADAPVVVWTSRGCGACVQAKRLLDGKRVSYKERRLKNDPAVQRAFARATGGARTVPQIVVGEHLVGGFDDLVNLERSGELDVMLGRAEPSTEKSLWQRLKRGFRS
ncbi:MAG: glutaredoxin domain-containing protein [Candidatus Thermoplasmatota archaeon]|nr:glutaredoxin domain-containing protein [Candidatus Thermoplasmatota archaeon]